MKQYSLDGALLHEYESIGQAARQTGLQDKSISKVLHGKGKTAGGYIWKFAKD